MSVNTVEWRSGKQAGLLRSTATNTLSAADPLDSGGEVID